MTINKYMTVSSNNVSFNAGTSPHFEIGTIIYINYVIFKSIYSADFHMSKAGWLGLGGRF